MTLTGPDFTTGAITRPGGVGFTDDLVIMPLQSLPITGAVGSPINPLAIK